MLHVTMQQSVATCSERGQRVQQIHQECETLRADFQDLTARVALSFAQVRDSPTQVETEAQGLRKHVQHTFANAGSDPLLHYSEEVWVHYIHEFEKAAATLPHVAL